MGKIRKDVSGRRFGRLIAIEPDLSTTPKTKWLCKCDCGETTYVQISKLLSGHTRSCGCLAVDSAKSRSGDRHPQWKGGKTKTGHGYILLRKRGHPNARKNGQVFEHVYVMSEKIGRPLKKGETVHHKNGIRDDNRIENLELWVGKHSNGQRVVDSVQWAFDVLMKYKPKGDYRKPLVYVAGALRGDVPSYISNCSKMIKYAEIIRRSGFAVYIPCLDFLQGLVMGDMEFEDYFNNSFAILSRCDVIYLIPGWENSEGTKMEIEFAQKNNMPIIENVFDLEQKFIEYIKDLDYDKRRVLQVS